MRILFDQGTPVPLRAHLTGHTVQTAFELGWSNLENGALLAVAEGSFELLITTDQQLRYQHNLTGRKLSVLVLTTTSWPRIKEHVPRIIDALAQIRAGEYREIRLQLKNSPIIASGINGICLKLSPVAFSIAFRIAGAGPSIGSSPIPFAPAGP
jgi:hypothetical protein